MDVTATSTIRQVEHMRLFNYDETKVELPKWHINLVVNLMLALFCGFVISFCIVVFWMCNIAYTLNASSKEATLNRAAQENQTSTAGISEQITNSEHRLSEQMRHPPKNGK